MDLKRFFRVILLTPATTYDKVSRHDSPANIDRENTGIGDPDRIISREGAF